MIAPSNSVPLPVLIVVGENAFQMIVSQMLVAMKREMPDPRPYLLVCGVFSRVTRWCVLSLVHCHKRSSERGEPISTGCGRTATRTTSAHEHKEDPAETATTYRNENKRFPFSLEREKLPREPLTTPYHATTTKKTRLLRGGSLTLSS